MDSKLPVLTKIVIFGVGLIGGSFALALKQRQALHVVGIDRDESVLQRAVELGVIDSIGLDLGASLQEAQLVLLAAPVGQTEKILSSIAPLLPANTVVMDVGSTKSDVVLAARQALGNKIAQFVPCHPVAGREQSGPDSALPDLFMGKRVVLTPLPENAGETLALVTEVWNCCGAEIHVLSPAEHDAIFAAVSHLPHLLAYTLVGQIADHPHAALRFGFAGSGFRDVTRIAAASPEMWRDISLANRAAILEELNIYQQRVQELIVLLEAGEAEHLMSLFELASSARRKMSAVQRP